VDFVLEVRAFRADAGRIEADYPGVILNGAKNLEL
jgi:hypothetical protein